MLDPLLHFQMEAAMQPAFDKLRCAAIEFAESIPDLEALIQRAVEDER